MKLQTSIAPRRNGVVLVQGQDRQTYTFKANEEGDLECEISDEATLVHLLKTDNFYPVTPEDSLAALELLNQHAPVPAADEDGPDGPEVDPSTKTDAELDLDDDEGDPEALPEEGAQAMLLGSDAFDSEYLIGERKVPLGFLVSSAHQTSGLTVAQWNELDQDDRDARIELVLLGLEQAAGAPSTPAAGPVEAETPPMVAPDRAAKANAAIQAEVKAKGRKKA